MYDVSYILHKRKTNKISNFVNICHLLPLNLPFLNKINKVKCNKDE